MDKHCRICHNTSCSNHGKNISFLGDGWKCNYIPVPTNADRIRGLTDEELAKEFIRHICCPPMKRRHCPDMPCCECWLNWLQQPVE